MRNHVSPPNQPDIATDAQDCDELSVPLAHGVFPSNELLRLHRAAVDHPEENPVAAVASPEQQAQLLAFERDRLLGWDPLGKVEAAVVLTSFLGLPTGGWNPVAAQTLLAEALSKDPGLVEAVREINKSAGELCATVVFHHRTRSGTEQQAQYVGAPALREPPFL